MRQRRGLGLTRFINAVLISLVAFFVFVAVFWQVMGDGAGRSPGSAPTVTNVEARWQPEDEREMLIELTLDNPSSLPARASAITYRAEVDGRLVDSAVSRPLSEAVAPRIEGREEGTIEVLVDLPDDFITTWWPTYMEEGEKADLRVHGTLDVRRDDGDRDVVFEWRSSWQGDLAAKLSEAVHNCSASTDDLCLDNGEFLWQDGGLHADLAFSNRSPDPVALHNMTIALLFGDRTVIAGEVDLARQVAADGEEDVGLALAFSQAALSAWWPDHMARCERTPVALRIGLEVEVLDGDAEGGAFSTVQWTFPASTFQTRFVCAP